MWRYVLWLILSLACVSNVLADPRSESRAHLLAARNSVLQYRVSGLEAIKSDDYINALKSYQLALQEFEKIPPDRAYFDCVLEFAELLESAGQFNDAITYYGIAQHLVNEGGGDRQRAAEISLGMVRFFAVAWNPVLGLTHAKEAESACTYSRVELNWCLIQARIAIADVFYRLGDYGHATPLYQAQLAAFQRVLPDSHTDEVVRLTVRILYSQMLSSKPNRQVHVEKLEQLQRTLDCRQLKDTCGELVLARAQLAFLMEQFDQADSLMVATLMDNKDRYDPPEYVGELRRLYVKVHLARHDFVRARQGMIGLLYTGQYYGDLARTTQLIAQYYQLKGMPQAEIFWLKRTSGWMLNYARALRTFDVRLGKEYIAHLAVNYQRLCELLLQENRVIEALDVLDLYKENKYLDFAGELNNVMRLVAHTEFERTWMMHYHRRNEKYEGVGRSAETHLTQLAKQTSATKIILADLVTENIGATTRANAAFIKFFDDFEREFADVENQDGTLNAASQAFYQKKRKWVTDSSAAFIEYLHGEHVSYAILMTQHQLKAFRLSISSEELNSLIQQHQHAIHYRLETQPSATRLYNALFKPLEASLRQEYIKKLTLFPDGVTQTLPFAALYDGKQYVLERYTTRIVSQVEQIERPDLKPSEIVSLMGNSLEVGEFHALPAVKQELMSLVNVLQKKRLAYELKLDTAFTANQFAEAVQARHRILHIASHYRHDVEDAGASFFLPGQGELLSLQKIKSLTTDYSFADLISLSACQTDLMSYTQSGLNAEGIGTLLLRRGAKSVLATKWQVHDAGSAMLMPRFYSAWLGGEDKARALQTAQLELLRMKRGSVRVNRVKPAQRGVVADMINLNRHQRTRQLYPYAHPYYWAGYVLLEH